jgi:C4-dicarboxylate-specific signal transduction histidine kinase
MKPEQLQDGPWAPIGEMLSVYRHHLGNSVNATQITLQVLMENLTHWNEAKIRTYLMRLEAIANEQGKLLRALKGYAFKYSPVEPVPTEQIWRQLSDMAKEMTSAHAISLGLGPPPPAAFVWGNLLALESIWRHLIGNACEAMSETAAPQLSLKGASDGGFIVFEIADNGLGIRQADLQIAQLPLFTTKKGKNGMGLALVNKLVQELTGQFEMDSVPEQGTQVRVQLRVASGHLSGELP